MLVWVEERQQGGLWHVQQHRRTWESSGIMVGSKAGSWGCGELSGQAEENKKQHFTVGFLFVLTLVASHLSKKASLRRIKWGFLVLSDDEVCKTQMAQAGQGQLDLLEGKKGSLRFPFPLYSYNKFSPLCPYPKIVQSPFSARWFRGREGPPLFNGSACDWVNTASPLLQRGLNIIFGWIFLAWLVPIYFSQNLCLILSLVMVYYMAWTGQLCYNEYKFAGCSQNSCCFLRGTVEKCCFLRSIQQPDRNWTDFLPHTVFRKG